MHEHEHVLGVRHGQFVLQPRPLCIVDPARGATLVRVEHDEACIAIAERIVRITPDVAIHLVEHRARLSIGAVEIVVARHGEIGDIA